MVPRPSRSKPGPLLSDKELQNTFLEICRDQTKNYKEESPIFTTDFQMKDLEHPLKRGDTRVKLKEICKRLEGQRPQEFSARFVDKDGEPLCFYLAKRWGGTQCYSKQYENRTKEGLKEGIKNGREVHWDGLDMEKFGKDAGHITWCKAGINRGIQMGQSEMIARSLGVMFSVLMPEVFKTYEKAFAAGIWEAADPGPWIGRAIVYKLQVELHRDKREGCGPTASFGAGNYEGGCMVIPQLNAKLRRWKVTGLERSLEVLDRIPTKLAAYISNVLWGQNYQPKYIEGILAKSATGSVAVVLKGNGRLRKNGGTGNIIVNPRSSISVS
ncbi:hypothetical protein BD779DRAFT_1479054 [Infundibulicybe gibba]|nr:hypothetical protein BD779DRAFT_1479054 [Infundibulicybe gibba]